MAENIFPPVPANNSSIPGCFKEAVCVDAGRIYDSCGDKDCLEDLRVYFTPAVQQMVDNAVSIRSRKAEVITVYIDVEPVAFNRGFYSVDLTFFFDICLDVYSSPSQCPMTVHGLSIFNKKVILYGSEGSVKIFSSDCREDAPDTTEFTQNLPRAVCQVADPIVLCARLAEPCGCCTPCCCVPSCICSRFGGSFENTQPAKIVLVSLGVFSICQIERNVQMLMPVYDFCVPSKECVTSSCPDNPCELFSKIQFPTDQFFPPRAEDLHCDDLPRGGGC